MRHPKDFDRKMTELVSALPERFRIPMLVASALASLAVMMSVLILGFFLLRGSDEASKLLLLILLSPLAELLKLLTRRSRPETLYAKRMRIKTYSFPSGHSYISALVYTFCIYLSFKYIVFPLDILAATLFGLLIFVVGTSRVYLGAHFPSDVLAGWALGIVTSMAIVLTEVNMS